MKESFAQQRVRLDGRPFVVLMSCHHWEQTSRRPTGTDFECRRGCRGRESDQPVRRRIVAVMTRSCATAMSASGQDEGQPIVKEGR